MYKVITICFALCGIFFSPSSFAQEEIQDVPEMKTTPWNVSLSGGMNFPSTDVNSSKVTGVFGVGLGYKALSFLQVNLDLQKGWLKEGDQSNDQGMSFNNSYLYASLTARFYPLNVILKDSASKIADIFYVGTGLAFINSNVKATELHSPTYGYIDHYKGTDVLIPIELGASVPVWNSNWKDQQLNLNLNLRHHFSFSDKLDGYEPTVESNKKNDVFSQILIGISYHF